MTRLAGPGNDGCRGLAAWVGGLSRNGRGRHLVVTAGVAAWAVFAGAAGGENKHHH